MTKHFVSISLFVIFIIGCQKTKENIAPPLAPSTLTATASSTSQIDLSWTDNSTTEDGFKIERKTRVEAYKEIASINKDITTYQDKGLSKATSYTYRVYAFNNGGKSPTYTNEATVSTLDDVPTAATNLTATALAYNQISLTWEDKASNETGYKVERKSGTDAFTLLTTLAVNTTTFKDESVVENIEYTYRIYPINVAGNGLFSNEAKVKTPVDIISGLVAYYPFTGNAGDSSGNGNHGIVNGATLTTDRFGNSNKAYSFNGTTNWISISDNNTLNPKTSITISLWVYSITSHTNAGIIGKWNNFNGTKKYGQEQYTIIATSFGLRYYTTTSITTNLVDENNNIKYNDGNWHHFVGMWDGTTMKLFRDNTLINSIAQSGDLKSFVQGLEIGRYSGAMDGSVNYFNGIIDDVRIYNRALSQAQITYLATH